MKLNFTVNDENALINESFYRISDELMNHCLIQINNMKFRIAELEFYYSSTNHPDPYIHKDSIQYEEFKWYFHRSSKKLKIKTGNRKGLDITFGNQSKNIAAGILIRGVLNTLRSEIQDGYINGPSRVVDKIMEVTGINDLEKLEGTSVFDNQFLSIVPNDNSIEKVYFAPRVGLSNKDSDFKDRPYRYFIYPMQGHAEKETSIIPFLFSKKIYSKIELLQIFNRKSLNILDKIVQK
jgi:3-methyladenine DNA glycosylase Mpg